MDDYSLWLQAKQGCEAVKLHENRRAVELLTLPADLGNGVAMFNLAIAHMRQGQVDRAVDWYAKAARTGDIDAMAYLGHVFTLLGDLDTAANWYKMASANGHAGAETRLLALTSAAPSVADIAVREGHAEMARVHEVHGNFELAAQLRQAAADAEHPESMFLTGQSAEGRGNLGEAMLWYAKAARGGFQRATERIEQLRLSS